MVKKVILGTLVFLYLQLFQITGICFADLAEQYEQAEAYRENKDYLQAKEAYERIISDYPNTEEALMSQRGLVIVHIITKKSTDANTAFDELLSVYGDYPDKNIIARAIFDVARYYEWSVKYKEANNAFGLILDEYPTSWFVNRANIAVVRTNLMGLIAAGKYDEAQAVINGLFSDAEFANHADLSSTLYSLAKRYEWSGKYEDANSIYEQVIEEYPESISAESATFDIPRMNVLSLFASSDTTAAYEALDNLIADFNDKPDLPAALYGIGETCRAFKKYEDANSIYEQLVQRYPESSYADKAQLEISEMAALSLIEKEDKAAAESVVNKITEDFNDHSGLAASLYNIAERYDLSRKFEDANNVYRQIVEEHPDSSQADAARLRLAKLGIVFAINSGKDDTVGTALDNLIADFNSHPGLATAVFMVGEQYYHKGFEDPNQCRVVKSEENLGKAKGIWEKLISELPVSLPDTAHAYYFSAVCSRKMAQYDKAITYYQHVVDKWPAYVYAWSAQSLIGDCFEKLRNSGSLSPSEANPKMEAAYTAVLENYPDCSLAPHACLKMAQLSLDRGQKPEAITFFEMFLELANPNDPRIENIRTKIKKLKEAEE